MGPSMPSVPSMSLMQMVLMRMQLSRSRLSVSATRIAVCSLKNPSVWVDPAGSHPKNWHDSSPSSTLCLSDAQWRLHFHSSLRADR